MNEGGRLVMAVLEMMRCSKDCRWLITRDGISANLPFPSMESFRRLRIPRSELYFRESADSLSSTISAEFKNDFEPISLIGLPEISIDLREMNFSRCHREMLDNLLSDRFMEMISSGLKKDGNS